MASSRHGQLDADVASAAHLPTKSHVGSYFLTRILAVRYLSVVLSAAFATALFQNVALLGEDGLVPACRRVRDVAFLTYPSMFSRVGTRLPLLDCNDDALTFISAVGLFVSLCMLITGRSNVLLLATVWIAQLSLNNLGSEWYGFGWETQLLETVAWTAPALPLLSLSTFSVAPSRVTVYYQRFLLFKLMLGAGLIKIRGSDCWRDLWGDSCMVFHYETQPNPHPLSWFLHYTPVFIHGLETLANHVVELGCPWLLLGPRTAVMIGGAVQIAFQVILILSGDLSFLNWLTIAPALWCFDDASLAWLFPAVTARRAVEAADQSRRYDVLAAFSSWVESHVTSHDEDSSRTKMPQVAVSPVRHAMRWTSVARTCITAAAAIGAVYLNAPVLTNLLSDRQAMNRSFNSWHLANTYGAFGSVHDVRKEIVLEGWPAPGWTGGTPVAGDGVAEIGPDGTIASQTRPSKPSAAYADAVAGRQPPPADDPAWVEYELPCKPGAPSRTPCLITPYHLRLDWLAWFAGSFGNYNAYPWTGALVDRLLTDTASTHQPETRPGREGGIRLHLVVGKLRLSGVVSLFRKLLGWRMAIRPHELLAFDPYRHGRLTRHGQDQPASHAGVPNDRPLWARMSHWEYRYTPASMVMEYRRALAAAGVPVPAPLHAAWFGPWPHRAAQASLQSPVDIPATHAAAICAALLPRWNWGYQPGSCKRATVMFAADGSGPFVRVFASPGQAGQDTSFDVGLWYTRKRTAEWLPALSASNPSMRQFLQHHGLARSDASADRPKRD